MAQKKGKSLSLGPILALIITSILVIALSFLLSKLGLTTNKTEIINGELSTTAISVNNVLSKEGISHLFSSIIENLKSINALYGFVIAMLGIGFADRSGLFKKLFKNARKFKLSFIIVLTLVIGCLLGSLGLNSYALFLPLTAYIYKNLNKNPVIGIITAFIALSMGQATGILPTYLNEVLGGLTEKSAVLSVDPNYLFKSSSLIYILISSLLIFVVFGKLIIDKYLIPRVPKMQNEEEFEELEVAHKGLKKSKIAFLIMLLILIYSIIPGFPLSGWLLGSGETYLSRLLSPGSPFQESYVYIFSVILIILGTIYGISSKKIKTFDDFTRNFSTCFSGMSLVFVFMFFMSQLIAVVKFTNLDEFLVSALVNWLSTLEITGLGLIIILFLVLIIVGIIMPDSLSKWNIIAPTIVPLLMRANMSASFAQFIFTVSDGIGKSISMLFPYAAILFGLIYKYTEKGDYGFAKLYKTLSPLLILFTIVWLVIIITWYVVGIPLGIGVLPSL